MPDVAVRIPSSLRDRCGGAREIAAKASTVRDVLRSLRTSHPELYTCVCDETGAVRRHMNVFVNDESVRDNETGLDTPLESRDVISIFTAVSGG